MASVCTIGAFQFADNECNLASFSKQLRFSQRNKRLQTVIQINLTGELIYSTTATIVTHINSLENALTSDYRDFRYTVGGVLSHQLLNSSDCCSGVKVIQYSLPKGTPEQLATTRSFSITLQGTYDAAETDLVSWRESIRIVGTGGPSYVVVNTFYGPYAFLQSLTTAVQYYQTGSAVGYTGYPVPPGPVNPAGEFVDRRQITYTSGRNVGNAIRFYTTSWQYVMGRDTSTFGSFDPRPTSQ